MDREEGNSNKSEGWPSADHVADALSKFNWIYLDGGDDGGVFDYDLQRVTPSDDGAFEVTLRVYSFWGDILEMEVSEIRVSPWDFSYEVYRDQSTNQWTVKGDDIIDPTENQEISITRLPDPTARIERIIDRDYSAYDPGELEEIHLLGASQSIRPYLESLIARLKVELQNPLLAED